MTEKEKYLVYDAEDWDFLYVIESGSEDELNSKILTTVCQNSTYKDNLKEGWEGFFLYDESGNFWDKNGNLRRDLEHRFTTEEELDAYIDEKVITNVTKFFGENAEWAQLYFETLKAKDLDAIELPVGLYEYFFFQNYGYNFDAWMKLVVRKLSDIPSL